MASTATPSVVHGAFDDAEQSEPWSIARLTERLRRNQPDNDPLLLRVLAARVATAGADNLDPRATIADLARALVPSPPPSSLTLRGRERRGNTDCTTAITCLAAARGMDDLTGWS
ncbi:hypothetical protein [Amycolatopsis sp. FDAARGOS 1241]|uniref:hypothetical protein n=1 Tax=Amycolatopsis sp. FDAARGOS 1241 TaxID=2778070 RepID=UPI00194E04DA|nr:hypothetical protein [Amycolatopsis sp. FDAARGOS 1241]QRP42754.1 hypothetical protein I6J71_25070 [Amycolatopsis sp. FDAARGOS 1241]